NKSIAYYQWLPRITEMPNGNIAITWSSWKQESDREGVYARIFDEDLNPISLEDRVNDYTPSYQWEPDVIATDDNQLIIVFSSWGIVGRDYEIVAKKMTPRVEQGVIHWDTYGHTNGITTSKFFVHVIDTTQLTGDTYEITFKSLSNDSVYATIQNLSTTNFMITDFPLDKGKNVFYLTETFEGVAVEFLPEFTLALDLVNSHFINHSGTNVIFSTQKPTGQVLYEAMDCGVIWADCDTLPDGKWANIIDSAYSGSMTRDIQCPFTIRDLTNESQLEFYIAEKTPVNKQWDPGENIIILNSNSVIPSYIRFHAQVNTTKPAGSILFPMQGDTNIVLTTRPLDSNDVFQFQTIKSYMTTGVIDRNNILGQYKLEQNYPNPFNPTTTIQFTIPTDNIVKLNIYNILGQKVRTLINENRKQGTYKVLFNGYSDNGAQLASGIYLYVLEFDKQLIAKKMVMLK
ncbi:MAG: T9SS type A sorting domain-containing protein, partial [Ignavibacteriales bacterium]|nr:T9SS type A sorting domain-containing protein [Ignavibacteriales bacterium]